MRREGFVLTKELSGIKKSHREIAVTTVAASGLATTPLQKSQASDSQGLSLRRPQKNR